MNGVIPEKLKEKLNDVKLVYESKGMTVYPNSFSELETEIVKVCNANKNLKEELEQIKLQNAICEEGLKKENKELRERIFDLEEQVDVLSL